MSLGPEKIILILVVALIVFGPQRLPDIARQVGAAMRELRKMQDSVRGELENVLHPDFTPPNSGLSANGVAGHEVAGHEVAAREDTNHAALPPATFSTSGTPASDFSGDYPTEDVTDDGFAGPRSFS